MLEQRVMERTASLERHTLEMHEVQDKLFHARQQLKQAEKMAAVGDAALKEIGELLSDAAPGDALPARLRDCAEKLKALANAGTNGAKNK
jgi:hypothetical protein